MEVVNNTTIPVPAPGLIISAALSSTVIILNIVGMILILRNQEINSRIKSCIIGHTVSDFLFGVVFLVTVISEFAYFQHTELLCLFRASSYLCLTFVTGMVNVLQALDQVLILRLTYSYTTWISTKKIIAAVIMIYIICILMSTSVWSGYEHDPACAILLLSDKYCYILTMLSIVICSVILVCAYVYIVLQCRKHGRQIADAMGSAPDQTRDAFHKKQQRIVTTLLLIVALYLICYVPTAVVLVKLLFFDWDIRAQMHPDSFVKVSGCLYAVNSAVYPLVFIWRLRSVRDQCRISCRRIPQIDN